MPFFEQFSSKSEIPIIFLHGAGAGPNSSFISTLTHAIQRQKLSIARYEFNYMAQAQKERKRRPPERIPKLISELTEIIDELPIPQVILGGKSMGGRIATMLLDHPKIIACFALGYPFHPKSKPDKLRTEHLAQTQKPCLIIQGTRDPLGSKEEVPKYKLDSNIKFHWIEDGDHDLKPRKASGFSHAQHINKSVEKIVEFYKEVTNLD